MKPQNLILILIVMMCLGFLPRVQAVVPAPDGYPGGNTAEGQNALFSLTSGGFNTAVGSFRYCISSSLLQHRQRQHCIGLKC